MAPRMATIKKQLENIKKFIKADKCAAAERIVQNLLDKISSNKKAKSANKYALYVKAQYRKISAQNPGKPAPEILKMIAEQWNDLK